jgi:phospholipid/cholesterol/gamma-HCH transport system substrate-binding protein
LPSQQQVRWSQLRVGLTVIFAAITLAVLIFLMSGTTGIFSSKITVRSYFQNSSGLTVGAPVRLQGVDIGNVRSIHIVPSKQTTPVEVIMRISTRYLDGLYSDSKATLATAGVLGATYVDIDSSQARSKQHLQDGAEMQTTETPELQDVIRSSQTTLQQANVILARINDIVGTIQNGKGSIGKFIYDESFFNKANQTLTEVQKVVNQVSTGIASEELYQKLNGGVDKLNLIIDQIQRGEGSAGKFVKDPALYNNFNQTAEKANRLMDDINSGRGALGKFAKDEEFARKIDVTMTKLAALSTQLEAGQGSAGRILKDPSLYNNADQMLVETRNLVKAIRENPKRYLTIHFKVF